MAKMTKSEMEKRLEECLNERWFFVVNSELEREVLDRAYYNGFCAAVAQIGGWERDDNGKHYVKLNG